MVEAEQVAQFVRVVGAAFHAVQEAQLAVDQDLAAAGEVDEDPGDAAGELRALHRGPQRGPVHGVQGLGDLSGLVLGGRPLRCLGVDVDLLAGAQSAHRLGKSAPGDLQGAVAQADQLDHEAAADAHGDDERGGDGEEAEEDGGAGGSEHTARERVGPVGYMSSGGQFDRSHAVPHARVRLVPAGDRGRRPGRRTAGVRGEHVVLGGAHGRVGAVGGQVPPCGAFGAAQVGDRGLGEGPPPVDGAGEQPQPLAGEAVGAWDPGQQGVLLGERLARAGELDEDPGLGSPVGVLDAAQRAAHGKGGRDRRRVPVVRLLPVRVAGEDGGAQWSEPLGPGDERLEPPGDSGGEFPAVGDRVAVAQTQPPRPRGRSAR